MSGELCRAVSAPRGRAVGPRTLQSRPSRAVGRAQSEAKLGRASRPRPLAARAGRGSGGEHVEAARTGRGADAEESSKKFRSAIDELAEEWVCPITCELPVDPVSHEPMTSAS